MINVMGSRALEKLKEIQDLLDNEQLIEVANFGSTQSAYKAESNFYKFLNNTPGYRVERHKTYNGKLIWVDIEDLQTGERFTTNISLAYNKPTRIRQRVK